MGLVSTGSALGGIGFPLMFERLLPWVGFANAIRLAALKIGSAVFQKQLTRTDFCRICYGVALCISTSKPANEDEKRRCRVLIDFSGYLDIRYTTLCFGTFFAVLGLWMPSYYISKHLRRSIKILITELSPETYANVAYPGNTISEYFLCMMNSFSILGAVL